MPRSAPSNPTTLSATLAPEDMQCGDYVSVLNVTYEFPSFLWCSDAATLAPEDPVRVKYRSRQGGVPLKVKAICLPFVYLKWPDGHADTLDVRQVELVRLDRGYAQHVWTAMRKQLAGSRLRI